MADKKGGQESKKGKPRSAGKAKAKIVAYYASGKLAQKKIRRVLRSNGAKAAAAFAKALGQSAFFASLVKAEIVDRVETATERRRQAREADAAKRLAEARVRHQAERLMEAAQAKAKAEAEAAAKLEAERKAKFSARAKKAAATRAANKAAKLAGTLDVPAELTAAEGIK